MKLFDQLRRRVTRGATVAALRVAGTLGCGLTRSLGVAFGRFAHLVPGLRQRLADNLHAAGMDYSDATVRGYFRRFGLWIGHSLGVYSAGLDHSLVSTQIELDPDTIHYLDEAVARGKGVILASPHLFCHEIGAGLIHRRYPVTALVRESKDAAWGEIKQHWYEQSLGVHTVVRPRKGSIAGDIAAMLRVLRAGKILGITPDVLTSRSSGLPVNLFNRTVSLSPGMILLAMRSGAPLIPTGGRWLSDPGDAYRARAQITFSPPLELPKGGNRETALRDGLQCWCAHFENSLRRSPADWLFWLDKGWTKVLRQPAVTVSGRAA
jgi:KDO2-lipid IV(A) lauroyltransferase